MFKKSFKKIVAAALTVVMVLGVSTSAFASEMDITSVTDMDTLIVEANLGNDQASDILAKNGIYKVSEDLNNSPNTLSIKTDVTLTTPSVYFDSNTNEYVAVGGGYWNNNEWKNDGNLTGADSYYLSLIPLSGSVYSASMNKCVLYVSDGEYWNQTLENVADNSNYENGIYITYDDVKTSYNAQWYGGPNKQITGYSSKHFSVLARYSAEFGDYSGNLSFGYTHTWNDCTIDSFDINDSGVSISFSDNRKGWKRFTNSVRF